MRDAVSAEEKNFAQRFEGSGAGSVSHAEALQRHQRVASHMTSDQYERAAVSAFERLSPAERKQFHQQITAGLEQHKAHVRPPKGKSAGELAGLASALQAESPGLLGQMLGGGGTGGGRSSIETKVLGGIASMAIKQAIH